MADWRLVTDPAEQQRLAQERVRQLDTRRGWQQRAMQAQQQNPNPYAPGGMYNMALAVSAPRPEPPVEYPGPLIRREDLPRLWEVEVAGWAMVLLALASSWIPYVL